MEVEFFFEFRRWDLSRETGGNFSVKPDSEAKYTASISLPLFTNSAIISAKVEFFSINTAVEINSKLVCRNMINHIMQIHTKFAISLITVLDHTIERQV